MGPPKASVDTPPDPAYDLAPMSRDLVVGLYDPGSDPFWLQVKDAIYQKAKRLPIELVPVSSCVPSDAAGASAQRAAVEELLALELRAVINWGWHEQLALPVLEASLPIVHLSETAVSHPLSVAPLGLYDAGYLAACHLAEHLHGRGHVLVVGGLCQPGLPDDGRSRLAGIQAAFARYPGIRFTHAGSTWNASAQPCIHAAVQALTPPLDGIIGLSDTLALMALEAARACGMLAPQLPAAEQIPIVGINGDPPALSAIARAEMLATVETDPYALGEQAIDLAYLAAQHASLPAHYPFVCQLITAGSVAAVASRRLLAAAALPDDLVAALGRTAQQHRPPLPASLALGDRSGAPLDPAAQEARLYRRPSERRAAAATMQPARAQYMANVSRELRAAAAAILAETAPPAGSAGRDAPADAAALAANLARIRLRAADLLKLTDDLCTLAHTAIAASAQPAAGDPAGPSAPAAVHRQTFAAAGAEPGPAAAGKPILIVDADRALCHAYQALVAAGLPGVSTTIAGSAAEAAWALQQVRPALVLLDPQLPDGDGLALIENQRQAEEAQPVPVLLLTCRPLDAALLARLARLSPILFADKQIFGADELAALLARTLSGAEPLPPQTSGLVKQAIYYIQQHFQQPINRADVAGAISLSENYLSQIFRQEMGISLWDYLNRRRINHARQLLQTTAMSITEVAAAAGIFDPAYFSRIFHQRAGLSPSAYRLAAQRLPALK